jgi:hypothetical protein
VPVALEEGVARLASGRRGADARSQSSAEGGVVPLGVDVQQVHGLESVLRDQLGEREAGHPDRHHGSSRQSFSTIPELNPIQKLRTMCRFCDVLIKAYGDAMRLYLSVDARIEGLR